MAEKYRKPNLRFMLAIIVGLTVWGLALAWYLHCKSHGSIYNGAFLAVNAPGIPGGFIGYWLYKWWGDGSPSGAFYLFCELGLPSLTLCLAWVNLSYQALSFMGREGRDEPGAKRRVLLACIPFVIGWCIIPFVIGRLAA